MECQTDVSPHKKSKVWARAFLSREVPVLSWVSPTLRFHRDENRKTLKGLKTELACNI